jgi:hypothetical protein
LKENQGRDQREANRPACHLKNSHKREDIILIELNVVL